MTKTRKTFFEQEIDRLTEAHALPARHYAYVRQSKAFMEKYHGDKIQLDKIAATAFMQKKPARRRLFC